MKEISDKGRPSRTTRDSFVEVLKSLIDGVDHIGSLNDWIEHALDTSIWIRIVQKIVHAKRGDFNYIFFENNNDNEGRNTDNNNSSETPRISTSTRVKYGVSVKCKTSPNRIIDMPSNVTKHKHCRFYVDGRRITQRK